MKIYAVRGTCGEYSDRTEWNICAYDEEHLAKAHVEAATTFTRAHAVDPYAEAQENDPNRPPNPWDPQGYYDHYDTPRYWYGALELKKVH